MSAFSKLLRKRRHAAALSQAALGERLGVSSSAVSRWEREIDLPEQDRVAVVSRFLRIPTSDLERMIDVAPHRLTTAPKIEDRIAELESRVDEIVTILARLADRIAFDGERIALTAGNRVVEVDDGAGSIAVRDGDGNEITWDSNGVAITGTRITLNASILDIAAASVNVEAGVTNVYGVAKCSTLTANTVNANEYTAGAGNVW
ncbi:MAG: helix-turn-helix transcriptional regulator [Gemmatimonadetes bacterium]|nr:helix-turn-helix transcriptional regulator [Gemmatimonadota bacterium]